MVEVKFRLKSSDDGEVYSVKDEYEAFIEKLRINSLNGTYFSLITLTDGTKHTVNINYITDVWISTRRYMEDVLGILGEEENDNR